MKASPGASDIDNLVNEPALNLQETHQFTRSKEQWIVPIVLGVCFAAAAAALVMIELAEPPKSKEFHGITLSNAINSQGARNGLELFRDRLGWLPYPASGAVLSPEPYLLGLRLAVIAMGIMQVAAVIFVLRRPPTRIWPWLVGPVLASAILLFYPPINTDIFSYASFGWEANLNINPYLIPPSDLGGDPFARFNDWTTITTPYGPGWTGLSRLASFFGRKDPFAVALMLKAMAGAAAIGLAVATYGVARRLTSNRGVALSAMVLVGWSPVLLIESAGAAHNDAVMMMLAVAGLFVAMSEKPGSIRVGLLLIAAAALIKPIAFPLLLLAALLRLAQPRKGVWELAYRWLLDALAVTALAAVALAPYWAGGRLPNALWTQQQHLYLSKPLRVNPLWVWAFPWLTKQIGGTDAEQWANRHASDFSRFFVASLLVAGICLAIIPFIRHHGSNDSNLSTPALIQAPAWLAVTAAFGLLPVNAHAWYAIWPLAPLALVWAMTKRTGMKVVIALCFAWILVSFLVYHTWTA